MSLLAFFPALHFGGGRVIAKCTTLKEPCQVEAVLPIRPVDNIAHHGLRRAPVARTLTRSHPSNLLEGSSPQTAAPKVAFRNRFPTHPRIHRAGAEAVFSSQTPFSCQGSRSGFRVA